MKTPSKTAALIADINALLVASGKKPIKSVHSYAEGVARLDTLRGAVGYKPPVVEAPVAVVPVLEPEVAPIVVAPVLEPELVSAPVVRVRNTAPTATISRAQQVHTIERAEKGTPGIKEADLRRLVPAVFNTVPHAKVSSKYQFVDTWGLVKPILDAGFVVTKASQGGTNARSLNEVSLTTQHMLRLRPAGLGAPIVGEAVPEIIIMNGHNGVTKFRMRGGLYRFVCANGMVVGQDTMVYESRHIGDVSAIVNEAQLLIERVSKMGTLMDQWGKIMLSKSAMFDFAKAAAVAAYGETLANGIDPANLLHARRDGDKKGDLWHVYNTVQENVMRGGIEYMTASNRHQETRGIASIGRDVGINAALWTLAEEAYAENAA